MRPLTRSEVQQIRDDFKYGSQYFSDATVVSVTVDRWERTVRVEYERNYPSPSSYSAAMSGDDAPPYVSHTKAVNTENTGTYALKFDVDEDPYPTR